MQRYRLVKDYLIRSEKRLKALEFLKSEQDYADVVREAQEVVELLLKALIMAYGLDIPKVHDVSKFIEENLNVFPDIISSNITKIKQISRTLRKEREISFYGMEDFIPSEEYTKEDAEQAINWAREIKDIVEKA
ncbi:MAG TPA: HEPN domain-containing protein, partial [Hydrogenobaculum sp.]|nr:HEPN domain-containing protein [Hydrogenobaculum sp.]